MALVLGTNMGFCAASPSADPEGAVAEELDGFRLAIKDTSPGGSGVITEIGWWQDSNSNSAADWSCALYAHVVGTDLPGAVIQQVAGGTAPASTKGWVKKTGLSWAIDASTIYWIAISVEPVSTPCITDTAAGAPRLAYDFTTDSSFLDPWVGYGAGDLKIAIYAVWAAGGSSSSSSQSSSSSSSQSSSSSSSQSSSSSSESSSSSSKSSSSSSSESSSSSSSESSSSSSSESSSSSSATPGTVCWGHDTAIAEDYAEDLSTWTGTATVSGSGDSEIITFTSGQEKISPVWNLGTGYFMITVDKYNTGSGTILVQYKTGATSGDCGSDTWRDYSDFLISLGYVQIKLNVA